MTSVAKPIMIEKCSVPQNDCLNPFLVKGVTGNSKQENLPTENSSSTFDCFDAARLG